MHTGNEGSMTGQILATPQRPHEQNHTTRNTKSIPTRMKTPIIHPHTHLSDPLNNAQALPPSQSRPSGRPRRIDARPQQPAPGIRRVKRLHKMRVRPGPLADGMQRDARKGGAIWHPHAVERLVRHHFFTVRFWPCLWGTQKRRKIKTQKRV